MPIEFWSMVALFDSFDLFKMISRKSILRIPLTQKKHPFQSRVKQCVAIKQIA